MNSAKVQTNANSPRQRSRCDSSNRPFRMFPILCSSWRAMTSDVLVRPLDRSSLKSQDRSRPTSLNSRAGPLRHALIPLVIALMALPAIVLRVWQIDTLGVNSDEAVYAGQAASLAGDPELSPYFPIFRAHPLLFQGMLSIAYQIGGVSTLAGRLMSAAFGLGTVALLYLIGQLLYNRRV